MEHPTPNRPPRHGRRHPSGDRHRLGRARVRPGETVVGFRTMLRWNFAGPDDILRRAVRAVDTATHPAHQRRGIFRALTAEGVEFVFTTPNDNAGSNPDLAVTGASFAEQIAQVGITLVALGDMAVPAAGRRRDRAVA